MSRTSATQITGGSHNSTTCDSTGSGGDLRCSNPSCNKLLAKDHGIQCPRCRQVSGPVHFAPTHAIGGGDVRKDWERHWAEAAAGPGCEQCGIPAVPGWQPPTASPRTETRPVTVAKRSCEGPDAPFWPADTTALPPIHFAPNGAIGGGDIRYDWQRHRQNAAAGPGCKTCGIAAHSASAYPADRIGFGPSPAYTQPTTNGNAGYPADKIGFGSSPACAQTTTNGNTGYPADKIGFGGGPISPRSEPTTVSANDETAPTPAAGSLSSTTIELESHMTDTAAATDSDTTEYVTARQLATKYARRPSELDTRGNDYKLKKLPLEAPDYLKGVNVLLLSADFPEFIEFAYVLEYLRERGATVHVAGPDWISNPEWRGATTDRIVLSQWGDDESISDPIDLHFGQAAALLPKCHGIYWPGGAWNPDSLRTDENVLRVVNQAYATGKLVATICHGGWVVKSAARNKKCGYQTTDRGVVNIPNTGIEITGVGNIREDLEDAGYVVVTDKSTVYSEQAHLLTSRDPNDLPDFCAEFGRRLRDQLARETATNS